MKSRQISDSGARPTLPACVPRLGVGECSWTSADTATASVFEGIVEKGRYPTHTPTLTPSTPLHPFGSTRSCRGVQGRSRCRLGISS